VKHSKVIGRNGNQKDVHQVSRTAAPQAAGPGHPRGTPRVGAAPLAPLPRPRSSTPSAHSASQTQAFQLAESFPALDVLATLGPSRRSPAEPSALPPHQPPTQVLSWNFLALRGDMHLQLAQLEDPKALTIKTELTKGTMMRNFRSRWAALVSC
jgi:hypothetical protein